jgi:hypothetical protein
MKKSELKAIIREVVEESNMENPCWKGYKAYGTKDKNGKSVPNCVPTNEELEEVYESVKWDIIPEGEEHTCEGDEFYESYGDWNADAPLEEAEYQGRKVSLSKPMRGDVKKFKVFVKDPSTGNVKKVNFGDPNMRIKKSNPARRKSFRARHNCENPGPKTKARYWSCRKW